jgi:MoaA/NifB/PqqE/SkfB family radical SAM enzyme
MATDILSEYPKSAKAIVKIISHEIKARKKRNKWRDEDISVPPLLIISTTDKCNLQCVGCYSQNICNANSKELPRERIDELVGEASEIGCSALLLAGGEPLISPDWIYAVAEHKEMLGLVFTNGTLLDDKWFDFFSVHRNMIVLFSVEGTSERTDERRGAGISEKIVTAMGEMRRRGIPFGISVTTGSHNISEVTKDEYINPYIEMGCRVIIHVEYVPMGENDTLLPLTEKEKAELSMYCQTQSQKDKAKFIAFPGDEEEYGGCLAAGRGFLHISAAGLLEPCPFAPYSDRDLTSMSLIEALKSPLLKAIRAEASSLHEGVGGCSLRNREAWIKEIIAEERAE